MDKGCEQVDDCISVETTAKASDHNVLIDPSSQSPSHAGSDEKQTFKPAAWLDALQYIAERCCLPGFIMVVAEKNGGKTSFLSLIDKCIAPTVFVGSVRVDPLADYASLTGQIIAKLGLAETSELNSMDAVIEAVNRLQKHILLIVDDAQFLTDSWIIDTLKGLKAQGDQGYFHLCIANDYSLVSLLHSLVGPNSESFIHSIKLGSLSELETKTYIAQKLTSLCPTISPLSNAQHAQFYKMSGGSLVEINAKIEALLKEHNKTPQYGSKKRLRWVGFATLMTVVFLRGAIVFYQAPPTLQRPVQESPLLANLHTSLSLTVWFNDYLKVIYHTVKDAPQAISFIPAIGDLPPLIEGPLGVLVPISFEKKVLDAPQIIKNGYTIQILASRKLQDINQFIHKHALVDFKIHHLENSKWYILTLGAYKNRENALEAVGKFSQSLMDHKPWIRQISSLKKVG